MPRLHARDLAAADIGDIDGVLRVADIDHGRIEADADALVRTVEPVIIEAREHDVVHRLARARCRE